MHHRDKTHCKNGHEFTIANTYKTNAGGRRCRTCSVIWSRVAWEKRKHLPRKRYNRHGKRQHLQYLYKLSQEQYDNLVKDQDNKCKACGKFIETETGNNLQVDHDHSCCSGPRSCGNCVRGLLCGNCNKILGLARDSIDTLSALINYLKR